MQGASVRHDATSHPLIDGKWQKPISCFVVIDNDPLFIGRHKALGSGGRSTYEEAPSRQAADNVRYTSI
jgi:hypothetical protein